MGIKVTLRGTLHFKSFTEKDNFGKYSATLLVEPGSEADKKARGAIAALQEQEFGGRKIKPEHLFFRDGDGKGYDGFSGRWFVSASRLKSDPPLAEHQMVGRNGKPVPESAFYNGCEVNMLIEAWAQHKTTGEDARPDRINAKLVAVQFVDDGTPLKTGMYADVEEGDFEDLPPLEAADLDEDSLA